MTKSADQEHASPSPSFPAYVFEGPAQVAIRTRTNDQARYVVSLVTGDICFFRSPRCELTTEMHDRVDADSRLA